MVPYRFCILLSPCWWNYPYICVLFCRIFISFRRRDHFYFNPFYVWLLNRHGWWAIRVVTWPMVSKTWTMYTYSGLGTNSASVAIVILSWSDILCPFYVFEYESSIVPFMTLRWVAGNKKSINKQFMAFMTIISIVVSIRTYLDDYRSW